MAKDPNKKRQKELEEMKEQLDRANEAEAERLRLLEAEEAIIDRINGLNERRNALIEEGRERVRQIKETQEEISQIEAEMTAAQEKAEAEKRRGSTRAADRRRIERKLEEDLAKLEKQKLSMMKKQQKLEEDHRKKSIKSGIQFAKFRKDEKQMKRELQHAREMNEEYDDTTAKLKAMHKATRDLINMIPGGGAINRIIDGGMKARDRVKKFQNAQKMLAKMGQGSGRMATMAGRAANAMSRLGSAISGASKVALGFSAAVLGLAFAFLKAYTIGIKTAVAIDKVAASIKRTTGNSHDAREELGELVVGMSNLGVTAEAAGEAFIELQRNLSSFDAKNKKLNEKMMKTIINFKRLGVDGNAAVKTFNHFEKSLGMTTEEASKSAAQIAMMGDSISIMAHQAISDFAQVESQLSQFGEQNIKVFQDLQALKKETGLGVDVFTKMGKNFDTFDSAARMTADLNHYLGTSLSHLDLMGKDYGDIAKTIQRAVVEGGRFESIDQLADPANRFQLQAFAEAAKMTTDEFLKLAQADPDNIDKFTDAQKQMSKDDAAKSLENLSQNAQSFGEAMSNLGNAIFMTIGEPFMKLFGFIFGVLAKGATMVAAAIVKYRPAFKYIMLALGTALGIALKVGAIGASIASGVGPVVGLVLAIAAGIGLLVSGIQDLWNWLTMPGSKSISDGMFVDIGKGIKLMGLAVEFALGPVLKLVDGLQKIWYWWHKDGSPMLYELPEHQAGAHKQMAKSMKVSTEQTAKFSSENENLHKVLHQAESPTMNIEPISPTTGGVNVNVQQADQKAPITNVIVKIGEEQLRSIIESVTAEMVGVAG